MMKATLMATVTGLAHGTMDASSSVQLNNGVDMPIMAFAAQTWSDDVCKSATSDALTAGFRFIWSSALIGTTCQQAQGEAINAFGNQTELFIAGTVNTESCSGYDDCFQKTLKDGEEQFTILNRDKLDMLMLDYPARSCDGIEGQWAALGDSQFFGRVRSLAVSNFDSDQLACLGGLIVPVVNQLHFSIGSSVPLEDNAKRGIIVQSYSPLNSGQLIRDEDCASIGSAHGKSAAQVAFRYILQSNATIATQSTSLKHLQDDLAIFDFILTDDEMEQLNAKSNLLVV